MCLNHPHSSHDDDDDEVSLFGQDRDQGLGEKLRRIVTKFRSRTEFVRGRLARPLTPPQGDEDEVQLELAQPPVRQQQHRRLQRLAFETYDSEVSLDKDAPYDAY